MRSTDIDWSKAPEGATHYREPGGMYYGGFYKQSPEGWFFFVDASWEYMGTPDKSDSNPLISRPAKPPAPEWDGEGLPPVGLTNKEFTLMTRISVARNESPKTTYQVVAHYNGKAVIAGKSWEQEFSHIVPAKDCRPLRTKEQRERDETVWPAYDYLADNYNFEVDSVFDLVNALYDAGMLRKAGD